MEEVTAQVQVLQPGHLPEPALQHICKDQHENENLEKMKEMNKCSQEIESFRAKTVDFRSCKWKFAKLVPLSL